MRAAAPPLIFMLFIMAGCSHAPPAADEAPENGLVSARLVAGDQALPGATILATRDLGIAFEEDIRQATSDRDGRALLELPAGPWYLTARSADGSIYGYYGPNPVQVAAGRETPATVRGGSGNRQPQVLATTDGQTGISGSVTGEKGPLPGAVVAFYLDASTQFRGPAYVEVRADDEGRFAAFLSPGRYYIVVRKRTAVAGPFGPLVPGDHFGYYASNPVVVSEGQRLAVAVGAVEVQRRTGWSTPSRSRVRLSGTIRDEEGRPLGGYYAFLHVDDAMLGKPSFVSEASDTEGRYEIWADREGLFFLGARQEIGRARELGEAMGRYVGSGDASVTVSFEGGEMKAFDIIVEGTGGP